MIDGNCVGCNRYSWVDDAGLCFECAREARAMPAMQTVGEQEYTHCRVCQATLRGKRADAQFCSDGCRQKFHRAMNAGHDKWCAVCDKSFKSKRADAETCSPRCRQALYRIRKSKQDDERYAIPYEIEYIEVDE